MTWPSIEISRGSAADAWARITTTAASLRSACTDLRAREVIRPTDLLDLVKRLRAARQELASLGQTQGLQSYARAVSGKPTFDLVAEATQLDTAYLGAIAAARALYQSLHGIAEDGTVIELPLVIDSAMLGDIRQALTVVEAAIEPSPQQVFSTGV